MNVKNVPCLEKDCHTTYGNTNIINFGYPLYQDPLPNRAIPKDYLITYDNKIQTITNYGYTLIKIPC